MVLLEAERHDHAVALVSHAPHAVAHALLSTAQGSPSPGVAGLLAAGSFRDGTRVAGRNAARTTNMLTENAAALGPVLDRIIGELSALRADLGDPVALEARLARAVLADDVVRHPEPVFERCASLPEAIAAARRAGDVLVVRRRGAGLEVSTER